MNRIDRLFAILLTLQHKRRVRAEDLAQQFEVSRRIIYRDLSALNQMGVPIAAMPGEGFELVEGFYLPPLMFKEEEAIALSLGLRLFNQQAAGSLSHSAASALAKINVVLSEQVRVRVAALTGIIGFITPSQKFDLDDPQLLTIQRAIQEMRVLSIRYHSYRHDEVTEREVEPHQLFYSDGIWYLEGYCRLRKGIRAFRLSRMEKLSVLRESFPKRHTGAARGEEKVAIRIRFAPGITRWVRERQHYGFHSEETTPEGVVMVYEVHDALEIFPWILGWGDAAEVLSPPAVRDSQRRTAKKLVNMLT